MAWIKTIKPKRAGKKLKKLYQDLRESYPIEYAEPATEQTGTDESIIESHTLIPEAMYHAFAEFSVLMSPKLPLKRRQHEMIATMVSVTNECHY